MKKTMRSLLVFLLSFALMFSMVTISSATDVSDEIPEDVAESILDDNLDASIDGLYEQMVDAVVEEASTWAFNSDLRAYAGDVCEGLFFIKSRASTNSAHYYLTDLDYYSVTGGSFVDAESQQWRLVDAGNGYYKIIAVQTGRCLTAASTAQEGMLSLTNYSDATADRQLWKFIATSTNSSVGNTYRIVPKAYENTMCLGISENAGFYGHEGLQKEYNSNEVTNLFNEWYLMNYYVGVNVYYDEGFDARYGDTVASMLSALSYLNRYAHKIFLETLCVNYDFYIEGCIESTADLCKKENYGGVDGDTINMICPGHTGGVCTVSDDCTNWEESGDNFGIEYEGSFSNINVLFTGHWLEFEDPIDLVPDNRSYYSKLYKIISMQNILTATAGSYGEYTLFTYVHELAHHLGAKDHYHDVVDGECKNKCICSECASEESRRESWCIMGSYENGDVSRHGSQLIAADYDELFCSRCLDDMEIKLRSLAWD